MRVYRMILRLAVFMVGPACHDGRSLVRSEGQTFSSGAEVCESSVIFTGESEGSSRSQALDAALVAARTEAVRSIRTEVTATLEQVTSQTRLGEDVSFAEVTHATLETLAVAGLEHARPFGEPHVEVYSDGFCRVRARIEVPKSDLDAKVVLVRDLERQAVEARASGRPKSARAAYLAISQLRPTDPFVFVQLARIEEQLAAQEPAALVRARDHMRSAMACNGGNASLQDPDHKDAALDLAGEVDRLTPHWDELLGEILRLSEVTRHPSFTLAVGSRQYARSKAIPIRVSLFSGERRHVVLVWIDDEGLYPLRLGQGAEEQFSTVEGRKSLELKLGTGNGTVRLVAVAAGQMSPGQDNLPDVVRADVDAQQKNALAAVKAWRTLLDDQVSAGTLCVAADAFEIVP